ncbi:MAG: hypothetical protein R2741_07800 [Methanolobus sp.]
MDAGLEEEDRKTSSSSLNFRASLLVGYKQFIVHRFILKPLWPSSELLFFYGELKKSDSVEILLI